MRFPKALPFAIALIAFAADGAAADPSASAASPVAPAPSAENAKGELTVDQKTTPLAYAAVLTQPGFFDETKLDTIVILSDVALSPEALADEFERIRMAGDGKLHAVEVTIDSDEKPISISLRHNGFRAPPSGMSTDVKLDLTTFDGKTVAGTLSVAKSQEFFGVTYRYRATFSAEIPAAQGKARR